MRNPMTVFAGAFALALALALPGSAAADPLADFYKDKRVRMFIGYSSGGGYDTYARVLARYMGEHLPGKPPMIPPNMPGAGSLKAANYIYSAAPRDGTAIGAINRGVPTEPLMGSKAAQFDPLRLNYLGSMNKEVNVTIAWHTSGVKTFNDLFTRELIVGGTGSGADSVTYPLLLNNLLGTKLKIIAGYPGGEDINIAMERGEITGRPSPSWSSLQSGKPEWIKSKKIIPLVQLSLSKHPDLPDVPTVLEVVKDPTHRQVFELFFARQEMGRPFIAPPELAADRLAALRGAFMATMKDARFLALARKQDLEIMPITGEEMETILRRIYATPRDVLDLAIRASKSKEPITMVPGVPGAEDRKKKKKDS